MIVDTHAHISPCWGEPVDVLLYQMDRNNVDRTTLVGMNGLTDDKYNQYLIDCVGQYPGRFSAVVRIDPGRDDVVTLLESWAQKGAEGLRLKTSDRSPGKDPIAIWRACAELQLPVSCQGYNTEDFSDASFCYLIKEFPSLPFIIEHQGKPDSPDPEDVFAKTLNLSSYPNVYIKIGGLGEICKRPFPFVEPFYVASGVPDYLKRIFEAFGPERMMWGSNFPPCSKLEGYSNTIRYLEEHLDSFCSAADKEWIFGKTALAIYPFRQTG